MTVFECAAGNIESRQWVPLGLGSGRTSEPESIFTFGRFRFKRVFGCSCASPTSLEVVIGVVASYRLQQGYKLRVLAFCLCLVQVPLQLGYKLRVLAFCLCLVQVPLQLGYKLRVLAFCLCLVQVPLQLGYKLRVLAFCLLPRPGLVAARIQA